MSGSVGAVENWMLANGAVSAVCCLTSRFRFFGVSSLPAQLVVFTLSPLIQELGPQHFKPLQNRRLQVYFPSICIAAVGLFCNVRLRTNIFTTITLGVTHFCAGVVIVALQPSGSGSRRSTNAPPPEPEVDESQGLFVSPPDETGLFNAVSRPWRFSSVGLTPLMRSSDGYPIIFNLAEKYADESRSCAIACTEIEAFKGTCGVNIRLHLSAEAPVSLGEEEKRRIGIPEDAKYFHFVYPVIDGTEMTGGRFLSQQQLQQIYAKIDGLKPELRDFLKIGGFCYLDENREHVGCRALSPSNGTSGSTGELCLGQAKVLTDDMKSELKRLSHTTKYPVLSKITVGPLLSYKLPHFKWLPPGDPMIAQMQTALGKTEFGKFGAFVYYSSQYPEKSCMVPVIQKEESKKTLRQSSYFEIENPEQTGVRRKVYTSEECTVCMDKSPEVVLNCNHAQTCQECIEQIQQRSQDCPTCRAPITKTEKLSEVLQLKSLSDFSDTCTFNLQKLNLGQGMHRELADSPKLQAPICQIPEDLKRKLSLKEEATLMGFIYPMYGKSADVTQDLITKAKEEVGASTNEALLKIGGFAFYSAGGRLIDLYSIEAEAKTSTIPITFQKGAAEQEDIDELNRGIEALKKMDNDYYNVCRITLGPFLPYAIRFSFRSGKFIYQSHDGKEHCVLSVKEEQRSEAS